MGQEQPKIFAKFFNDHSAPFSGAGLIISEHHAESFQKSELIQIDNAGDPYADPEYVHQITFGERDGKMIILEDKFVQVKKSS